MTFEIFRGENSEIKRYFEKQKDSLDHRGTDSRRITSINSEKSY